MGRDLKDELLQGGVPAPGMEPAPMAMPTIQIQISEAMEKQLVEIVLEDWGSSKTARTKKDYGIDSKGSAIDFVFCRGGFRVARDPPF